MNIRDMKYLIAVSKYQHFGKAAEACFVSQPALSMQIHKLEETLGVKLFERTNKSVMTTDVGKKIVEHAENIIKEVDEINQIAKVASDPLSVELKIGAFPTLAPYYLPKAIPKITTLYPKLKLHIIEDKTENLIEELINGKIDAAFLATPLPYEVPSLEYTVLFKDEFLLAVPDSHKFAEKKRISRSDISGECLFLLDDGHCLRDQALDICTAKGATENEEFRASSLETLRHMVIANKGITLIPKIASRSNDGLNYLEFTNPRPTRTISMVWRNTSPRKDLLHNIAQHLV